MRFQVPQFLNVEDRIFGPLTVKQFVYLVGAGGFAVVLFRFTPRFVAIVLSLPIVLFGVALAFYRLNGKPFTSILEAGFKFLIGNRLYIWKKVPKPPETPDAEAKKTISSLTLPKLSESRLKDLTWSLDVKENLNPGANETMKSNVKK